MEAAGSVTDIEAIRAAFAEDGVAVTSGDEFPMGFQGFDDATGALWMPATPAYVEGGQFVLEKQSIGGRNKGKERRTISRVSGLSLGSPPKGGFPPSYGRRC